MLEPKNIEIDGKAFIIHKFPAIEGREICCSYPLTAIPKVSEYKQNEAIMLKLMKYVSVQTADGVVQALNHQSLVDNHVKSWEMLMRLEAAVLEYNCTFFHKGLLSTFFESLAQKIPAWISKILMDSLAQLSPKEKQP